jgi:hypothetical protein
VAGDDKPFPSLTQWLTGLFGLLVAMLTVVGVFVKITPFETVTGVIAVVLFLLCLAGAGVAVWSHRRGAVGRRLTAVCAVFSVGALVGGVLLAVSAVGGAADTTTEAGAPTITTQSPTTAAGVTTTTPMVVGGDTETGGNDPGPGPGGGVGGGTATTRRGQDNLPNTGQPPGPGPNPTQQKENPPPGESVRSQSEFRLNSSAEGVDLDLDPPAAYGPANELAVDEHAILPVPAHAIGVTVSGSPTRAECVDAIGRANPPAESFDDPRPGDVYCVQTSGGRYALVRVVSAATWDYTLAITVWN